jgi:hypothetical protein
MNPEIKAKWLEALRSGKYKQAEGRLKVNDTFCCLGVLCDISGLSKWDGDYYLNCVSVLPDEVAEWSGLGDKSPNVKEASGRNRSLAGLNDDGNSFKEIADLIERYL